MEELFVKVGLPVLVFVAMAIVGTELTLDDFRRMLSKPVTVLATLVGQCILLPVIGWILVQCFTFQPTIAEGLLLVVACPSGAMANVYNYVGRANVALSVTLAAMSCLIAVGTTPLALAFLKANGEIGNFSVPLGVLAGQLMLLLILPVLMGMAIRWQWPDITARHGRTMLGISIAAFAALLGVVIANETDQFINAFGDIVVATGLLTILAFSAGWGMAWASGAVLTDRFTVGMVFVVRNAGIATAMAVTVLGRLEFAVFATAYFLTQMPILVFLVVLFKYRQKNNRSPLGASGQ